jgi:DNA-binding response OmpR family regulator
MADGGGGHDGGDGHAAVVEQTVRVLVYSDDRTVRTAVHTALGRRPAPGLPRVDYVDCATAYAVTREMDAGRIDLAVFDGEATPTGGLGLCRQMKDEIFNCPPVLVLTGRPQDAWLATWSKADAAVPHPLDPELLAENAAALLRDRLAGAPSRG